MVVASVTVPVGPEQTFAAFTDEALYSRWLEVPVRFREGQFAATMEWGTEIGDATRCSRLHTSSRSPGTSKTRTCPCRDAPCRDTSGCLPIRQAAGSRFTNSWTHPSRPSSWKVAWGVVLRRLRTNLAAVLQSDATSRPRAPRSKERMTADQASAGLPAMLTCQRMPNRSASIP